MRGLVPLLVIALVIGVLWWRHARRQRAALPVPAAHRETVSRTITHFTTATPPGVLLEAVVERLLAHRPPGRPPRRYVVVRRDERSVEIAERLVEARGLGPVTTVLVEADADPDGPGTRGRYEVLDILEVDRVVDRLADVTATREQVLGTVVHLDRDAVLTDEVVELDDPEG